MNNVFEYVRRNRKEDAAELAKLPSEMIEEELVLKLKKEETRNFKNMPIDTMTELMSDTSYTSVSLF